MLNPDDVELLTGRSHGLFVCRNPDGTAHATPVWVGADEQGNVLVDTSTGRKKDRNVLRDPRVTVSVVDHENAYRWVTVAGTVVERQEGTEEALKKINEFSLRYTGTAWEVVAGQVRVLYRIRPDRVIRSGG